MIQKSVLYPFMAIVIFSIFPAFSVTAQNTPPDSLLHVIKNGSDWRVYSSAIQNPATVALDSLGSVPFTRLHPDSVKALLKDISIIPKEREPVWMGIWIGSYQAADGQRRKVLISEYGGFFMDVKSGRYIMLSSETRNDWLNYVTKCLTNLSSPGKS